VRRQALACRASPLGVLSTDVGDGILKGEGFRVRVELVESSHPVGGSPTAKCPRAAVGRSGRNPYAGHLRDCTRVVGD
jgi:hypothetical protein